MVQPFLIFGHRGSPRRFPENTLPSFDDALAAGADGFETDLRLLSDRTAILFHDDELDDDAIESLTLPQITGKRAAIQRVSELRAYAARTTMVLEVKRSKWEDALLEEIDGWPNTIIASFDHSIIAELHRRKVASLGVTTFGVIVDIGRYVESLGASWCFPAYRYVDGTMVAELHHHNIRVVPWTPNRVREWDALRAMGCDGVITDLPHEAVEWRSQA